MKASDIKGRNEVTATVDLDEPAHLMSAAGDGSIVATMERVKGGLKITCDYEPAEVTVTVEQGEHWAIPRRLHQTAMNEVQHHRMQESAEYGAFLMESVANHFGCEVRETAIVRCIYKDTECGAWIKFDEQGILVGTIVEGSDGEYQERIDLHGIDQSEQGAAQLIVRLQCALLRCEAFSEEHFDGNN